jgi:two-component system nitrogen regulation sensor histidine kinase NtrY
VTFRTKLLLLTSLTVAGAVALVTGAVAVSTRRAFERLDVARREALLEQFRRELDARGEELSRRVEQIASSAAIEQITSGAAEYDRAQAEAQEQSLDFLDVLQPDLTIISSAHWPARFGYKNDWNIATGTKSFLARITLPEGNAVALISVRSSPGGKALVAGGRSLNAELLKSLGIAPGMRALLWRAPDDLIDAQGAVQHADKLEPLIAQVKASRHESTATVQWTKQRSSSEAFLGLPLFERGQLMGVLLAGTSLREEMDLENAILWIGIMVGGSGIAIGILLGWWTTRRVTHPVEQLAAGARSVAAGDWSARVEVVSHDEIGELAQAFNQMTQHLVEQRDRAIQAERVAAWRELARRLAHELKNPLFPLQITIENLQRARERSAEEFDEVFREGTTTLLAELSNLKTIVGRFSDFAKMPAPQFERVDVNELVRGALKLYDARLHADDRAPTSLRLELADGELPIAADSDQLRRALSNLVLNAMDAMPDGGTLHVVTAKMDDGVRISVADTGLGLTPEECERLFTPYYTTKHHGTGLGLAIVQSVVSDHHGKISVVSEPGRGSTFIIELPLKQGEQI